MNRFRQVDQHTGNIAERPSKFWQAMSAADNIANERAITREIFAMFRDAVGTYSCPCGSVFEFADDSTLEEYAALNRWLGRHESCNIGGSEMDRLERDNTKLREQAEALLCRVEELEDELIGLRDAHRATLGLLAQAREERDTYWAATS